MNKASRRIITLLPPLICATIFVVLQIYAFSHSKQANLGLALITLIGFVVGRISYRRLRDSHHVFDGDPLRPFYFGIVVGFIVAFVWYVVGAFFVPDPQVQVMMALGPSAVVLVVVASYVNDRVSKSRRHERG